jgi:hypothetical protein
VSDILPYLNSFNIAVSWGLFILIWLVQIIIYPGLARIPAKDFVSYHAWYMVRITAMVLPLMIVEVIITVAWLFLLDASLLAIFTGGLVAIIWLSTFALQVPIHQRLQSGKDASLIRRLVATNWIRTAVWSLKAVIVTVGAIMSLR